MRFPHHAKYSVTWIFTSYLNSNKSKQNSFVRKFDYFQLRLIHKLIQFHYYSSYCYTNIILIIIKNELFLDRTIYLLGVIKTKLI